MKHIAQSAGRQVHKRSAILLALASTIGYAATPHVAHAQATQTVIYNFTGAQDGAVPSGTLFADNLYGFGPVRGLYITNFAGGTTTSCIPGCGTVFKLQPPTYGQTNWTGTPLWDFAAGTDGDAPLGGVYSPFPIVTSATPLFGTSSGYDVGNGTIFSLTGHTLTTLYTFTGGTDGLLPSANVVFDLTGSLYTTTQGFTAGGTGTAVKLSPPKKGQTAWTETTLWVFSGGNDGGLPSSLTLGLDGNLYGTTLFGGTLGYGTVFRLVRPTSSSAGWTLQTLWNFGGTGDGSSPSSAVTFNYFNGTLYGTTTSGGSTGNGTVFSLCPPAHGQTTWTEKVLYSFTGGSDGATPLAPLTLDLKGNLFGTASAGGNSTGAGSVFKLTPPASAQASWTETTLYDFSGPDGADPASSLAVDNKGNIYGTTQYGGTSTACAGFGPFAGCGVVFSLTGTGFAPLLAHR